MSKISQSQLQEVWLQMREKFEEDERMKQNIENHLPTINEHGDIVICLNELQKEDMKLYEDTIQNYLKEKLNTASIRICYNVEKNKKHLVSEELKLQEMKEKYPILEQFIEKLGLTIDR